MTDRYRVLCGIAGPRVTLEPGDVLTAGREMERSEAERHVKAGSLERIETAAVKAPENAMRPDARPRRP